MIATLAVIFLLTFCAMGWAYWISALLCLRATIRGGGRRGSAGFAPPVSILKPVKGIDAGALENFASYCEQEYGDYEILFGVADRHDPAVALIENIRQRYPRLSIRLIVAQPLGANPKAAILHRLVSEARGQVLAISDSDIRVTPEYLRRVVAPLADPRVGLVTCLYRGQSPANLPSRLEALYMDSTFAPSAALAWRIGTRVGLGATMVMRKDDLQCAGGYAAIADHLLDDYEVAARIARLKLIVHLSDYPVASVLGSMRLVDQWRREVRWSRGIRTAYPIAYPGMLVTFSLPVAIAAAALSGTWHWAWIALPIAILLRCFIAWRCAILLQQTQRNYLIWLPLRDLLSCAVWVAGLVGRRVSWRGHEFELKDDGRLTPLAGKILPDGPLAALVRRLDRYLRRRQGIFEYTDDEQCVLRLSLLQAKEPIELADGTRIDAGDSLGELHLWNEQLPQIPLDGPDLHWATSMRNVMRHSLRELARVARTDRRLTGIKAFTATSVFGSGNTNGQVARLAGRYGFESVPVARQTWLRRFHDFWENFLLIALQWVFNPRTLRGKKFRRWREPLWISRRALLARYGAGPPRHAQAEPVGCPVA